MDAAETGNHMVKTHSHWLKYTGRFSLLVEYPYRQGRVFYTYTFLENAVSLEPIPGLRSCFELKKPPVASGLAWALAAVRWMPELPAGTGSFL